MPPVFSGREPYLCCPGRSAEHGPALAACRRGSFYDHSGLLLTGLETRYLALCFPGENNYTRLYAFTDSAGQALLYRNRNRSAPFLLEVDRDLPGAAYAALQRHGAAQKFHCASI